ncbi:MAG TPA: KH domain-containing protein [Armatimonadota bacterium]|nr:KH domain-containing protein [Armatimonadota bacterium]
MVRDVVELLVRRLVSQPDQAYVEEQDSGQNIHIQVRVDASDRGKIIGRRGRVINAIRSVAGVAAVKAGQRVTIDVPDD